MLLKPMQVIFLSTRRVNVWWIASWVTERNTSDDVDAYDLIMKDKERLLDRREPVRFIFSTPPSGRGGITPMSFKSAR